MAETIATGKRAKASLPSLARLVLVADLAGSFIFALEGGWIAIAARLDLLGIAVIAFVAALGGGILRDVLLGDAPPAALRDPRYPCVALAAAACAVLLRTAGPHIPPLALIALDAAGLALFAIAGAEKALSFGCNGLTATMLGTMTGVGGGATRDVLLAQVPAILRTDFYATAALAGAAMMVLAQRAGLPPRMAALMGGVACFGLRMAGAVGHWGLPRYQ